MKRGTEQNTQNKKDEVSFVIEICLYGKKQGISERKKIKIKSGRKVGTVFAIYIGRAEQDLRIKNVEGIHHEIWTFERY